MKNILYLSLIHIYTKTIRFNSLFGLFARMPIANRAYGTRYHKFMAVATRSAIPPASAIPIGIAKLLIIRERKHCKALTVMPPRNPQMFHSSRLTGIVPGNLQDVYKRHLMWRGNFWRKRPEGYSMIIKEMTLTSVCIIIHG